MEERTKQRSATLTSATPPVSNSPPPKKGLPPKLQELVGKGSGKKGSPQLPHKKSSPARGLESPADFDALNGFIDQSTTLLKFRAAWEEAIHNGDQQKALAFTAKACKLLAIGIKFAQKQRGVKKDDLWAAIICQACIRSRIEQKRFRVHMYRAKVANEMVNTERSYMRALGIAMSVYRKTAERFLGAADVNVIFSNLEGLRSLNVTFWRNMENRVREWNVETCLGDIYISNLKEVVGEYIKYVQGYDAAMKLHEKLLTSAKNKDYAKAMEDCAHEEVAQGLTLGAYLILPVQRFPRYQLLLQDMLKHTPKTHPDYGQLEAALAEVVKMCNAINEATRNSEHFVALQKMERLLDSGVRLTDRPNRTLKAEAEIHENIGGKWVARTVLIFDDMMVCVQKKHNRDEGWHVEWHLEGANSHVGIVDPAATVFDLIEFRRIKTPPYSETVKHVIRPLEGSAHNASFWADTVRQYQASVNIPAIMSDTHQWLTTNLVTSRDWDLIRQAVTTKSLPKDGKVFASGQRISELFLVDAGNVLVRAPMGKHVQVQVAEYAKGAFFGIECMLRDSKSPHEACCSVASTVSSIQFKDLVSILVADPHLCHRFWLLVCVTLAERFYAWDMPKNIERHYIQVTAGSDLNLRDTLATVFSQTSAATAATVRTSSRQSTAIPTVRTNNVEEDEKICNLFGIPAQPVLHQFEDVQLGQKGKRSLNRGMLYIFASHICFFSKLVGRTLKEVFPMQALLKIGVDEADANKFEIVSVQMGKPEVFVVMVVTQSLSKRVFDAMTNAFNKFKRLSTPGGASLQHSQSLGNLNQPEVFRDARMELTDAQWDQIFEKCATTVKYKANQPVVEEGQVVAKIFQVLSGHCRVEGEEEVIEGKQVTKKTIVTARLGAGEMFGEQSFLFGGAAVSSIIADQDGTEVYVLERAQLERLFGFSPELAGPFYKVLAEQIEARLSQKNENVLHQYSALLVKKLQGGDINMTSLMAKNPAAVRVARPVRKESLGQLSAKMK